MNAQQQQVDEVIGIMHKNMENVLERDSKLTALEERADALEDGAAQFEKQAGSLKNKYASNNLIIAAVVGVLVLGGFYWYLFMQPPPPPPYPYPPPPPAPAAPAAGGDSAGSGGGAAA